MRGAPFDRLRANGLHRSATVLAHLLRRVPQLPCPPGRAAPSLLALAVSLTLTACAGSAASTPAPSAVEVRDRAAEDLRALSTVGFRVSHPRGGTELGLGTLTEAEGYGLFPDRAAFLAKAVAEQFGGITLEFDVVQIGSVTYLRDRISNRWQTLPPGALLVQFTGINDSIADALAAVSGVSLSDGGAVDGAATRLLRGTVESAALRGLAPTALEGTLDIEVWVGLDDSRVRRVSLTGVLLPDDRPDMTRVLDLYDFNAPVIVEPPI